MSFDSVRDDFKSLLLDMSSDSEDFSDNFSKMLQQAVIEGMMKNEFNDRLAEWYDAFVAQIENDGSLDFAEQTQLSDAWNAIVNDALTQRNQLRDAMGWETTSESQSSTGGYSTQLSEDTGTLINGRLTAMQDSNERIAQTVVQGLVFLQSISVAHADSNSLLSDILTQSALANIHLSDIVKYTKEINSFGEKLDKIVTNTKNL